MSNFDTRPSVSPSSRRTFLKQSVVGISALAGVSIARGAHAAGKEEVRIGMIGCGGRCAGAASQCLKVGPYVKLAALGDIFPEPIEGKWKLLTQEFPGQVTADRSRFFVGFDAYKNVIDNSDVVLIACASKFHPIYAEAAINAGRHVFVEKPHGIDPVGVRRMQAACDLAKRKGLSLLSGLQSRYQAGYRETIGRILDGAIGDIVAIQSMFLRGPYNTISRNPKLTETQYQFNNWYHFSWLSGDDVTQSLTHNLDRASWILKGEMPKSCFGLGGRSSSFGEVYGDMFDHHTVVYEYASGARVYALCRTQDGCYGNSTDVVLGTRGKCYLGDYKIVGEKPWRYQAPIDNPYEVEQKALIESVRNGKPINSGHHMAKSTMVAVMGQLACYEGRELTWDEVEKANFQFGPSPEQSSFATPPPKQADSTGNYPLPKPGITRLLTSKPI